MWNNMVIKFLIEWNPWWKTGKVPDALKGRPRRATELMSSLSNPEITVLIGVRRSGKSTLMFQMVQKLLEEGLTPENILFVNMDDMALRDFDIPSIESAYRQRFSPVGRTFIFYDEVHAKTGWEAPLRKRYDLKKDIKYVVTGSSSSLLKGEYSTLLTGRNLTFAVHPLSFPEYLEFNGIEVPGHLSTEEDIDRTLHRLEQYLEFGGFPEVQLRDGGIQKRMIARQYFHDIIYRDIVYRHNVEAQKIAGLASHLLTNFCNPFTMRALRRATGLSFDTIRQYLGYLEESYLIRVLSHLSYSSKPAISEQRPRKAYCVDSGLRNAICYRITGDKGRMAENVVAIELFKKHDRVFYWKGKKEVDFVLVNNTGDLEAINVCYNDEIPDREIKGLNELRDDKGPKVKSLLLLTRNTEDTRDDIELLPLWKWLLTRFRDKTSKGHVKPP